MPFPRIDHFDHQIAVVIGIDDYHVDRFRLTGARADADAVSTVLRDSHGYSVIELRDDVARMRALVRVFGFCLPAMVTARTQLLVYFAGHGLAYETPQYGLDGFLLPVDATEDHKNWFSMRYLRSRLARLPCHHLLLVLDCCFAGAFTGRAYRDIDAAIPELRKEQYEHYLTRRAQQLIASSAHDERALDRISSGRAPFTTTLVNALSRHANDLACADLDRDGVITATDVYTHLRRSFADMQGVTQTPNIWPLERHDAGEYIFTLAEPVLRNAPELTPATNPYRGLHHFTADDADVFKGRALVVEQLVQRIRQSPLVVLLGPSGSGKSSVLHAGLVPGLEKTGIRPLGPLRPGVGPVRQLFDLLGNAREGARSCILIDQLEELTAAPATERALFQALLAFVVQGDEVDEPLATSVERRALVNEAVDVLRRLRGRCCLVLAIRSDAEPHFLQHGAIGQLLGAIWKASRIPLPPMNRDELRECVVGPVAEKIVFFTSVPRATDGKRLVDVILNEVEQMPDALPMLSVALQRMFELFYKRQDPTRTIEWVDYPEPGGIVGALQDKAERLFLRGAGEADPPITDPVQLEQFQDCFRRVLLRMISWRGQTPVRSRVDPADLKWPNKDQTELAARMTKLLLDERLIATDDDGPDVQPVHDALMTGWPRLSGWLQADRDKLLLQADIHHAATAWLAAGKPAGQLWTDVRMWRFDELLVAQPATRRGRLRNWLWRRGWISYPIGAIQPHVLTATEQAFVEDSLRSRKRGRRLGVAIVAGIVAALSAATLITYTQRDAAISAAGRERAARQQVEQENRVVTARALALTAAALAGKDDASALVKAALVAVESLKLEPTPQADMVARSSLALLATPIFSGRSVAVTASGAVFLVDATGNITRRENGRSIAAALRDAQSLAVSPDGGRAVLVDASRHLVVIEQLSGATPRALSEFDNEQPVIAVAISHRGSYVVTRDATRATLWDAATGRRIDMDGLRADDLVVSPDERWLVAIDSTPETDEGERRLSGLRGGNRARMYDLKSLRPVQLSEARGDASLAPPVAFSEDGKRLAAVTKNSDMEVWDLSASPFKLVPQGLSGHQREHMFYLVTRAALVGGDPRRLAVGTEFGGVAVVDVPSRAGNGSAVFQWEGEGYAQLWRPVEAVSFDPSGRYVAASFAGGTTRIWDVVRSVEVGRVIGPAESVLRSMLLDADRIILWYPTSVGEWSIARRDERLRFPAAWIANAAIFDQDGAQLAFPAENAIEIASIASPSRERQVPVDGVPIAFDGKDTLILRHGDQLERWFVGEPPRLVGDFPMGADAMVYSGSAVEMRRQVAVDAIRGEIAVIRKAGSITIFDFAGRASRTLDLGATGRMQPDARPSSESIPAGVAAANGRMVVSWSDGRVGVYSSTSREHLFDLPAGRSLSQSPSVQAKFCVLSRDGTKLVTLADDGTMNVWELDAAVARYRNYVVTKGEPQTAAFDFEGNRLALIEHAGKSKDGSDVFRTRVLDLKTSAPAGTELGTEDSITFPLREQSLHSVAFSPDGRFLAVNGGGVALVLPLNVRDLVTDICARVGTELSDNEWSALINDPTRPRRRCLEWP